MASGASSATEDNQARELVFPSKKTGDKTMGIKKFERSRKISF